MTNGDIRFDHVRFSYAPEIPLLEDICFTVPAGRMYAIVGPSASGKSTVVNLIPRLFDVTGGAVTVAGVDVREFDLTWQRQNIGVVSQETYLFNGTIRENLLYAKEDASREELEQACRIASIHDFIVSQPDGYDTMVGNRGLVISGGVITESGTHESLLAQDGIYRELYETQFRTVLEYEAEAHPLSAVLHDRAED